MTERINIERLRDKVQGVMDGANSHGRNADLYAYVLPCADVLALIGVVEAAKLIHDVRKIGGGSCELCEALERFDFGEAA